ncbi:mandelate racemase/muconate lactonizing enzyme family protein [Comamonadaceae bacterium G21597-S1]|nr:mandelate racemase/muconate lactonizing enzyme family protein [Comamonadaceae bacterium G21597-S1]
MNIRSVRTLCFAQPMVPIHAGTFAGMQELVLTVVEADDGTEGYSLARAHGGQAGVVIANQVEASLRPLVLGRDAADPAAVWESLAALEPPGYVSVFAISALDVALWDLAGKLRGLPVAQLCGGRRNAMQAYASSCHYDTVDGYIGDLQAALALGFAAYKVHPFYDPQCDIALAAALREAAGPEVRLMLDAAKRYGPSDALRVGEALQALAYHWYEEPLPQQDWADYRRLREALAIPVIGGETLPGLHGATANALDAGAFDAVLCDVYWKGGITGCLKTMQVCAARGVPVASHHGASALMNLANLHVLCGASDVDMLEVLVPQAPYHYGLREYLRVDADGMVRLPVGPGLGGQPDWAYIEAHRTG